MKGLGTWFAAVALIGGCSKGETESDSPNCRLPVGECRLDEAGQSKSQAFLDCWIPCQTHEQCAACIEPYLIDIDVIAGLDAGMCGAEFCAEYCSSGSETDCDVCMQDNCGDLLAIVSGEASYPEGANEGPTCWDIKGCTSTCQGDQAWDCFYDCYWSGSMWGRHEFWTILYLSIGPCAEQCGPEGSRCGLCIDGHMIVDYRQPGCEEPDEPIDCSVLSPEYQVQCYSI